MAARPPRGFALLVVLWTVALLALLGAHITGTARQAASLSLLLHGAARAEALADGLVAEAIFRLLDPSSQGWKADGVPPRGAARQRGPARWWCWTMPGGSTPRWRRRSCWLRCCATTGWSRGGRSGWPRPSWTGAASATSRCRAGRSWRRYRAAGLSYGPPHEAFRSPEELGLVLGMTPDVLAGWQPHLSVWTRGRVRLERADPVVAQAVRTPAALAANCSRCRRRGRASGGGDRRPGDAA